VPKQRRRVAEHPPLASAFFAHFSTQLRHLVDLVDELALHTVQGFIRLDHGVITVQDKQGLAALC
jgi:hypothetical protein